MPNDPYAFEILAEPRHLTEQSHADADVYAFAYTITITNTGQVAAQLIARHWTIEDAHGHTETVDGLGVVGEQPLLQPGQAFRYTSACRLRTAHGLMHGHYFFVAVDGHRFEVAIPPFLLRADPDLPGSPGAGRLH